MLIRIRVLLKDVRDNKGNKRRIGTNAPGSQWKENDVGGCVGDVKGTEE